MPKGVRTTTDGFAKAVFGEAGAPVGADGTENVTIKPQMAKRVQVKVGTSVEDVLRWDSEGAILLFESKDEFLPMDDAAVKALSRENKTRYAIAKEFHDAWRGDAHAKLVEEFKVDKQMIGSPTDKLKAEVDRGLEHYWARPDKIESYRAKGWKIADADEARSFLGPKGGHHEVGKLGETQLVLMVIPKELRDRQVKEVTRKSLEQAGAWKGYANEMDRSGGQAFVASEDDRRARWTELPNETED